MTAPLGPERDSSSPITDRVLILAGILSGFFSLNATRELSPEDASVDFFIAFFLASVCLVAWLASVPKKSTS